MGFFSLLLPPTVELCVLVVGVTGDSFASHRSEETPDVQKLNGNQRKDLFLLWRVTIGLDKFLIKYVISNQRIWGIGPPGADEQWAMICALLKKSKSDLTWAFDLDWICVKIQVGKSHERKKVFVMYYELLCLCFTWNSGFFFLIKPLSKIILIQCTNTPWIS